jgi:transposase
MVMGLCLLVYSLGQRALRQALERAKKTIDNQLGKPTSTPTDALGVSMFYVDSFGYGRPNQANC